MIKQKQLSILSSLLMIVALFCCAPGMEEAKAVNSTNYEDLVSLFEEWREFQKPKFIEGVPDYTAEAMEEQRRGLEEFRSRLLAIDPSEWPISQQADYHIVRAEMNGLEFDHRVLRPWSRDPGFYITTPLGFGPRMYGSVRIPRLPLKEGEIEEFRMKLQAVPKILDQARGNLTDEVPGDLVLLAIRAKAKESAIFESLAKRLAEHHPDLVVDAERAREACDAFHGWLKENEGRWTGPSGIGKENYDWYLKNVHLFPYTWDELLVITQQEYDRAVAFLKLEENRNRRLPELEPASTEEEYKHRYNEAEQYLLEFLRKEEIFTVPDYLIPRGAGPYRRSENEVRDFFQQCGDRDPLPLRCHNLPGHDLDSLRLRRDDRPIRGVNRLYFIDGIRAEALATGLEEILMHAGLLDERPRTREITYILLANRAARSAADLKMHSNEFTLMDAINYCVEKTPYGWLPDDGNTVWFDMELYLRQPSYGMGYLVGKCQLTKLVSDRAQQLGDKFNLRQFFDEFLAAGMIPITLTRWQMTGMEDEIRKMW